MDDGTTGNGSGKLREQKATNITWHEHQITAERLERRYGHKGATLWFTGLSASGKSTIANAVAHALFERGIHTFVLDGDNVRHGLNKDLGFSPDDRVENIRRIGEAAKLFTAAGIVNLCAFISPYAADRKIARDLQPETFYLIHCHADVSVCEERDPKGMYQKARSGKITGFTGIDSPYEVPVDPELRIETAKMSIDECVEAVIAMCVERGILPPR